MLHGGELPWVFGRHFFQRAQTGLSTHASDLDALDDVKRHVNASQLFTQVDRLDPVHFALEVQPPRAFGQLVSRLKVYSTGGSV